MLLFLVFNKIFERKNSRKMMAETCLTHFSPIENVRKPRTSDIFRAYKEGILGKNVLNSIERNISFLIFTVGIIDT